MLERFTCSRQHFNLFPCLFNQFTLRSSAEHCILGKRAFTSSSCQLRTLPYSRTRNPIAMSADYQTLKGQPFDRAAFESLLRRKNFLWQSFEPYGAVKVLLTLSFHLFPKPLLRKLILWKGTLRLWPATRESGELRCPSLEGPFHSIREDDGTQVFHAHSPRGSQSLWTCVSHCEVFLQWL